MHVAEIGSRTVPQSLDDDLAQALGRKGVIRQAGQGQPLEADLPTVALPAFPDGGEIGADTMEDRLDLMEMAVDPVHGVILADVLPQIKQALRFDPQAKLFEDLPSDRVAQSLAMILATPGEYHEFALLRPDPHRQDLVAAQDDGPGGRADPG